MLMKWFFQLPAPDFVETEGARRTRDGHGLCWFRSSAIEHVQKAGELAAILNGYGFEFRMLRTRYPGHILYEDDHQIVAEPAWNTPLL